MLWLYRIFFVPVLLVLAPVYLRRMWRRGGYGAGFGQRLGGHVRRPRTGAQRVWLQAVSVGEMLAIGPLLEALHADGVEVWLTTTTSTGFRLANERYRTLAAAIGYFPIDWWPFSARAWRRIRPDLVILTEGERWPEHLAQAARRRVPVLSVNARLSDRSYRRMRRFPGASRAMLRGVSRLLACSAQDAARFRELGVSSERIIVTGNIKLDVDIPRLDDAAKARWRRDLGLAEGLILLGSSTWPGEELALLEALKAARARGVACSLLLVPRHAERRNEIDALLAPGGLRYHLRSRGNAPAAVDVAIADTTGELRQLTQLADLVFVGKSLPPHTEGQTPVEAAALEKPILFGPGMGNFRAIARDLLARGAAWQVADRDALVRRSTELLEDGPRRADLAAAAARWHRDNTGAVARTLAIVREELLAMATARASRTTRNGAGPAVAGRGT
jgi:3-deoxy-D-manno-octulosonic-acid transferase